MSALDTLQSQGGGSRDISCDRHNFNSVDVTQTESTAQVPTCPLAPRMAIRFMDCASLPYTVLRRRELSGGNYEH